MRDAARPRERQLQWNLGIAFTEGSSPCVAGDDQEAARDPRSITDLGEVCSQRGECALRETDEEIKAEVDRFYEIARESLSAVWRAVEAVATALLKHEELDRDGVDAALEDIDISMPVFEVQKAHGLLRDRIQLKPSTSLSGGSGST